MQLQHRRGNTVCPGCRSMGQQSRIATILRLRTQDHGETIPLLQWQQGISHRPTQAMGRRSVRPSTASPTFLSTSKKKAGGILPHNAEFGSSHGLLFFRSPPSVSLPAVSGRGDNGAGYTVSRVLHPGTLPRVGCSPKSKREHCCVLMGV